jgi:hypothetical protein
MSTIPHESSEPGFVLGDSVGQWDDASLPLEYRYSFVPAQLGLATRYRAEHITSNAAAAHAAADEAFRTFLGAHPLIELYNMHPITSDDMPMLQSQRSACLNKKQHIPSNRILRRILGIRS